MAETWGNLKENERDVIKAISRKLSEKELEDRFKVKENVVLFKIQRKSERTLAGILDIDKEEHDENGPGEESVLDEESILENIEEVEEIEIRLISPQDFDYEPEITDEDRKAAAKIDEHVSPLDHYYETDLISSGEMSVVASTEAETAGLPNIVDHRTRQSPVKDQFDRGTCVAHASMGLIEAFGHIPDNLSEQCAHYKFNEFLGRRHDTDSGLKTTDAAPFLTRNDGRVCLESDWPYITYQSTIDTMVAAGTYGPPATCQNNYRYGYNSYKIITDNGLTGESIKNTRYLEALLYKGYNIVIGTWVSWDDKDQNGVLDPVLDPWGNPVGSGGHAMLVVGYNRNSQYFIVKNSWGRGWGHNGYAFLHYNLVRSCFKYGFVVHSVEPTAPTKLPKKLARAPYTTNKINRTQLRTAIVYFKTSQGRYAVAEAYAGYNLYLKNLRVYNADGTVHLKKNTLVIRGTYLCDIDSGRETSYDADFWWEAVRPGVNYLVPRNGAAAYVAYNFAAITPQTIGATSQYSAPVPYEKLDYAVIIGTTTAGKRYKMIANAKPGNTLQVSIYEAYNSAGRRVKYAKNKYVLSSWTYNLDTLQKGGGRYADIWWHVISDGVGYLEKYSWARTQLLWHF